MGGSARGESTGGNCPGVKCPRIQHHAGVVQLSERRPLLKGFLKGGLIKTLPKNREYVAERFKGLGL